MYGKAGFFMFKWLSIFLIVIFVFSGSYEAKALSVSAQAAILIDSQTGKVLYEKHAHNG